MSAMQRFYTALCRGLEVYDLNLAHLVQLTLISLAQMRDFSDTLLWWIDLPTVID